MTGSPINLNKVRKARARAEDKARAAANTVAFGQSKTVKSALKQEQARDKRHLDGTRLERSSPDPEQDKK